MSVPESNDNEKDSVELTLELIKDARDTICDLYDRMVDRAG